MYMNGTKNPMSVKNPLHVKTKKDGEASMEKSNIVIRVCMADL